MQTIWHLKIKTQGLVEDRLYTTLLGLLLDNAEDIGFQKSKGYFDRYDWSKPYIEDYSPNQIISITKRQVPNTREVRERLKPLPYLEGD